MKNVRFVFLLLIGAVAGMQALAQYPSGPIRVVVPFAPGGAAGAAARIVGQPLSQALGQPVLVDFKPGADGQIAGIEISRSAPDGHTLFLGTASGLSYVPAVRKPPPYDALQDFTPISSFFLVTFALVVHPDLPARTVRELIDHARAHAGKLSYGTATATAILTTAELLASTKTEMVHIPFKGEGPALLELLAGRIQLMFMTPGLAMQHVKEGKLRVLAVTSTERSPLLPDVPTLTEAGLPASTVLAWGGIFGPPGMPRALTDRLSRELNLALARPDVRAQLAQLGYAPTGSTPEELGQLVKGQLDAWRRALRQAGVAQE